MSLLFESAIADFGLSNATLSSPTADSRHPWARI